MAYPERIVCLTGETTETLYRLGEQIVGISGYTVRPPQARRETPRVSAFASADIDRILDLRHDLVLGFSDLQADIAAELIPEASPSTSSINGTSPAFSPRSGFLALWSAEPIAPRAHRGADRSPRADPRSGGASSASPAHLLRGVERPLITGIGWVSELLGVAGGEDCFAELAREPLAHGRIVAAEAVVERRPDIIVGLCCGKRFRPERVAERPGWAAVPAVQSGELHEIKSSLILQAGPAALTDGLARLEGIIDRWSKERPTA